MTDEPSGEELSEEEQQKAEEFKEKLRYWRSKRWVPINKVPHAE